MLRVAMLGPPSNTRGGIATVCSTLVAAPAMSRVDLRFYPTTIIGNRPQKLAFILSTHVRLLGRSLSGWRPHVVHIHAGSTPLSFYREALFHETAKATGASTVLHLHSTVPLERRLGGSWSTDRRILGRPNRIVVLHDDMRHLVQSLTKVPVQRLFNPVELPGVAHGPHLEGPPTILFMGRINDSKGAFDLLRVIPHVLQSVPQARFVFGGDGEFIRLRQEAADRGLDNHVEAPGWIGGAQRDAAFARAWVYCLPSHHEGLPLSVLEAMARGLPVIATRVGGVPAAVEDGATGRLIAPKDSAELARTLVQLLQDPNLIQQYGHAGRRRVESCFSRDAIAEQLLSLWQSLAR